jgi:acetoin utilization deacetylase AcuC-like enzyme
MLYSPVFLRDYPTVDCEAPERLSAIHSSIGELATFLEPEPCSIADLSLCHSESIITSVQRSEEVFEVARLSAGAAINAAEYCFEGPTFSLARPPGHHAGRNFNGGFCFFNNIALAIQKLLLAERIRSALIVDIDLHYGNGTFDIFQEEKRVTFKNVSALTRAEFFEELEGALADAARYDVVGCSAGFDTYIKDWGSLLFTEDFKTIGSKIASSNPHVFFVLEGGYYITDLGRNVYSFLRGIQEACS